MIGGKFLEGKPRNYRVGQEIRIENPYTERWEKARIVDIRKFYMVVQTRNYQTAINKIDIEIGEVKIREG